MDTKFASPAPRQLARRLSRRQTTGLAVLMGALTLVSVGATASSLALFTSQTTVTGNAFTAGTIVLGASPATALLTASALMPGDTIDGTLVVTNSGTGALRYAMSSASTNTDTKSLRDVITLDVKTLGTSCAAFDGTSLYSGVLGASTAAIGNPATGAQTGDRALAALASETLCFRATLPILTGNAFQGTATTTTFTFDAEQTANN
jgi:predicted ribosomally synthesized peptide with SipW-like signal peptide